MADDLVLPSLTIAQLQYLVAVADHRTWAEAAESVGVTTSALSQGVAELQRRLGVPLFERRGRVQVPLAQADTAVSYARSVLAQTGDLARWAADYRSGDAGPLRVGMIDAAAIDHYSSVLAKFRVERPEVDLRLNVAPSGELLEALRRGSLDVVVCVDPAPTPGDMVVDELMIEPLLLYAPGGAKAGDSTRWGPWVTFPRSSHTRAVIAAAAQDLGARFEVVAESNQPEVLREMVRLGLGWTVLPAAQAEREPNPLVPARKTPIAHRRLVVARRAKRVDDPVAQGLVDRLLLSAESKRGSGSG